MDETRKAFSTEQLNGRLAHVCRRAGLRIITWHKLRHTFATHLAMRGTPLNVVQTLLGHSSVTTTMRYAHATPSSLRQAIELLNPNSFPTTDFGQPVGNLWNQRQQISKANEPRLREKAFN
jgi:site-specific recombinase XerD